MFHSSHAFLFSLLLLLCLFSLSHSFVEGDDSDDDLWDDAIVVRLDESDAVDGPEEVVGFGEDEDGFPTVDLDDYDDEDDNFVESPRKSSHAEVDSDSTTDNLESLDEVDDDSADFIEFGDSENDNLDLDLEDFDENDVDDLYDDDESYFDDDMDDLDDFDDMDDLDDDDDDDDDFDENSEDEESETEEGEEGEGEADTKRPPVQFFNWPAQEHFYFEIFGGILLLCYVIVYFVGSQRNDSIAEDVYDSVMQILKQQFIRSFAPRKNSAQESVFFATGRRNTLGFLSVIDCAPRHDIFRWVLSRIWGSRKDRSDVVTFQIALPERSMEPFVAALVRESELDSELSEVRDLKTFASIDDAKNLFTIAELEGGGGGGEEKKPMILVTDSPEYFSRLFDLKRIKVLKEFSDAIIRFHLTDVADDLYPNELRVIHLSFEVQWDETGGVSILPIQEFLLWLLKLADRCAGKSLWRDDDDDDSVEIVDTTARMGKAERDRNSAARKKIDDLKSRRREEKRRKRRLEEEQQRKSEKKTDEGVKRRRNKKKRGAKLMS